jgi:hypothetical protein
VNIGQRIRDKKGRASIKALQKYVKLHKSGGRTKENSVTVFAKSEPWNQAIC